MGLLDDLLGSAAPKGGVSKPLMIALLGLLASGALSKLGGSGAPAGSPTRSPGAAPTPGSLDLGGLLKQLGGGSGGGGGGGLPGGLAAGGAAGGLLGGLGPLLEQFQNKGLGDLVDSWVGTGQNKPLSPHQLQSALDPEVIETLQEHSGLPQGDLMRQLSQILPGLVDGLTPQGRMPTDNELSRLSEQLQ